MRLEKGFDFPGEDPELDGGQIGGGADDVDLFLVGENHEPAVFLFHEDGFRFGELGFDIVEHG